jgi:cytochrome c-type protein NapB
MKKTVLASALTTAAFLVAGFAMAQSANSTVESLRGTSVDAPTPAAQSFKWKETEGRTPRNYRQQPPLIPHTVQQYQIDLRTNQCLGCHDWTKAGERGAPTLSMTHYLDREGNELDHIAGTRYFCNQCHVPQADAPELVENDFQPSYTQ